MKVENRDPRPEKIKKQNKYETQFIVGTSQSFSFWEVAEIWGKKSYKDPLHAGDNHLMGESFKRNSNVSLHFTMPRSDNGQLYSPRSRSFGRSVSHKSEANARHTEVNGNKKRKQC